MSTDPMKAALEAQKMAMEMQQQMQQKLTSGELDPTQMAQEYMSAMAGIMPDLSALQQISTTMDPSAMMSGALNYFEDDEDDEDDIDYDDPDKLSALCNYLTKSMDAVAQLPAAPASCVAANDPKWLQMGILCSGILSNLNGHNLDQLSVEEPNDEDYLEEIEEGLEDSWGIQDREDLLEMLTWLGTEGHRARYAGLCKATDVHTLMSDDMDDEDKAGVTRGFAFANRFKAQKPASTMLGWDLGRSALLIRFGYYLGWLTEAETSLKLVDIAQTLSEVFHSWQEFGISYQFGAAFWKIMGSPCSAKENNDSIVEAITELLTADMFGSAGEWGKSPWLIKK